MYKKERPICRKEIEFIYDNYYPTRKSRQDRFGCLMDLATGKFFDMGRKVIVTISIRTQARKMLQEEYHDKKEIDDV